MMIPADDDDPQLPDLGAGQAHQPVVRLIVFSALDTFDYYAAAVHRTLPDNCSMQLH
jgi:hypothetical protein